MNSCDLCITFFAFFFLLFWHIIVFSYYREINFMKSNRLFSRLEDWGMDDGSHFTAWGGGSVDLKTEGKKEECVEYKSLLLPYQFQLPSFKLSRACLIPLISLSSRLRSEFMYKIFKSCSTICDFFALASNRGVVGPWMARSLVMFLWCSEPVIKKVTVERTNSAG